VYWTPDDLANRFELRVLNTDPHADAFAWPGPLRELHHRIHRPPTAQGRDVSADQDLGHHNPMITSKVP